MTAVTPEQRRAARQHAWETLQRVLREQHAVFGWLTIRYQVVMTGEEFTIRVEGGV